MIFKSGKTLEKILMTSQKFKLKFRWTKETLDHSNKYQKGEIET